MSDQWFVIVRDIPANEDEYIGAYRTKAKAWEIAHRLQRDIDAVGASNIAEAFCAPLRSGLEVEDLRDEMLAQFEQMGYEAKHPAPGGAFGSASPVPEEQP